RLLLIQPGHYDDPLRLSLIHSFPAHCRNELTALSYTWGSARNMRLVECNDEGESILLTRNCENAVRRLRSTTRQEAYWIDAICINQDDVLEREVQVRGMGDIYRAAADVVVYLGEEDEQSQLA
ncbi:HET-domain-containing protein, partial [Setomelanomma holmii]